MQGYITKIVLIYKLIICLNEVQAAYVIPNDGKFFYAVLGMGLKDNNINDVNTMYLSVLISNTTEPIAPSFKLGLSTSQ
jgi:hypothetical protein